MRRAKAEESQFGISHIAYELPGVPVSVEALAERGLLDTDPAKIRSFGFEQAYISEEPAEELALRAARRVLAASAIVPDTVSAVFYAGATPATHAIGASDTGCAFHYPVARLQYELGLDRAIAAGVSQVGCMGMVTAVRQARDFLSANPTAGHVLCVSADVLPGAGKREMLYNVISDGACALLVSRGAKRNRILEHRQVTKGYYWDSTALKNEIIAAYFPTARNLIRDTLAEADLAPAAIDWIIPHNVSLRSWEVLLGLLEMRREQLFAMNIARTGHVIAADNWINLQDASEQKQLQPGQKLLLFNFGYGANWSCTLLEH